MAKSRPYNEDSSRLMRQISLSTEVHLRRMKVRDALEKLERYLNDAAIAGMPRVRVIHGKSGGIMKAAVHEFLDKHPIVSKHYPAAPSEGNGGVTIAEIE